MSISLKISLLFLLFWSFVACKNEEEFRFNIDDLTHTAWGIPQIVEAGMEEINLDAPTIFDPSGFVTIGNSRTDFWRIRGNRTIFLEQAQENWFIISLNPQRLYVEKTTFPGGTFIVKCIYEPLDKK
jgi:hypothetical protein